MCKQSLLFSFFLLAFLGLNAQNLSHQESPNNRIFSLSAHPANPGTHHQQDQVLMSFSDQFPQTVKDWNDSYFAIELVGGEAIFGTLNVKAGVQSIYGIVRLGFSQFENAFLYSYGIGAGTQLSLADKHKLSFDLSVNQLNYDFDESLDLNLLGRLDINYRYGISDRFSVFLGPSFNTYVTREQVNGAFGTLRVPYTLSEMEFVQSTLQQWIGFNIGLAVNL